MEYVGITISEKDNFNFLGIVFNNRLPLTLHISTMIEKVSKIVYVIKGFQTIYPESILKIIYMSLIQSISFCMVYCFGVDKLMNWVQIKKLPQVCFYLTLSLCLKKYEF